MRVLIDICHPAHVHFFRNPIRILEERGHEVLVTSRDKEMTLALLDSLSWRHETLSSAYHGGVVRLFIELIRRNFALAKVAREFQPDVMAAIGGIFIAQVGRFTGVPSVVFYDTENAKLQNLLTYPFASLTVVPRCYEAWLPKRHKKYSGYHELSYLDQKAFVPDREIALANGLSASEDTFVIRVVSWNANHDIGEKGWSKQVLTDVVMWLAKVGKVIISSESPLPPDLKAFAYSGHPESMHHVMAFSRLFVGESATMASESVVLGVPAIYAANTGRGYCNEQEARYGLLRNVNELVTDKIIDAIKDMLSLSPEEVGRRYSRMLLDMIDVSEYVADTIETMAEAQSQS